MKFNNDVIIIVIIIIIIIILRIIFNMINLINTSKEKVCGLIRTCRNTPVFLVQSFDAAVTLK